MAPRIDGAHEQPALRLEPRCIASTGLDFNPPTHHESTQPEPARKYDNNFFSEAQFSPDGTSVVTQNADRGVRTFVLPQDLMDESRQPHTLNPYSVLTSPTNVQSYTIYPGFNLQNPSTTLILSAPTDQPLRLTNALDPSFTHATYPYINTKTEAFVSPNCLAFHLDGSHFVAGSHGSVAIFDASYTSEGPIAKHVTKPRNPKLAATSMRDSGLIMSLGISDDGLLAAGSSNRTVGIFPSSGHGPCETAFSVAPERNDPDRSVYNGTAITSVTWTPDGKYLLVGERQSDGIHVYDVRNQLKRLAWLSGRNALTTQRLGISIVPTASGLEVWAGGVDGAIRVWQNPGEAEGICEPDTLLANMHGDSIASAIWHPGGAVMASCSGQRRFGDEDDGSPAAQADNSLKIWSL